METTSVDNLLKHRLRLEKKIRLFWFNFGSMCFRFFPYSMADSNGVDILEKLSQPSLALLSLVCGIFLLVKKEKALSTLSAAILSLGLLLGLYSYVIPHYLPLLNQPELIRGLSSSLLTVVGVVAAFKLAQGAVYVLIVALLAPLTYQILGVLWQLNPAGQWDQAKLFVSLFSSVSISAFLVQHLQGTAKVTSVLLGSFFLAASIQYLYEGTTYLSGIDKCLGTPKAGWDASECSPFYISWLSAALVSVIWSGVAAMQSTAIYRVPTPRTHEPLQPLLYRRLEDEEALPHVEGSRGFVSKLRTGGSRMREFIKGRFSDVEPMRRGALEPTSKEAVDSNRNRVSSSASAPPVPYEHIP